MGHAGSEENQNLAAEFTKLHREWQENEIMYPLYQKSKIWAEEKRDFKGRKDCWSETSGGREENQGKENNG